MKIRIARCRPLVRSAFVILVLSQAPGAFCTPTCYPPQIQKKFGAESIPLYGSTALTFTILLPGSLDHFCGFWEMTLTDNLPAGLVVSAPNGLTMSQDFGTITAVPGSRTVSLSDGFIYSGQIITFSVNVTGVSPGTQVNTTGPLCAYGSLAGCYHSAEASVEVLGEPAKEIPTFSPQLLLLLAATLGLIAFCSLKR